SIGGMYPPAAPAPALGDDTNSVLAEHLGLGADEIVALTESGTVATGTAQ
ncbi:L-carnitine dehydratase/bile acid-inducible protein F, partial [Mycolicibacterium fortuitum subsp. fortuitum DSM 46621 = ATCC 6841 = JCM 6387]